jgi:ribosomal protein S16
MKNYPHNVIRLKRGKKVNEHIFHIVAILNKRKLTSSKIVYKLGYIQYGKKGFFVINLRKLGYLLNKGYRMKKSVKKLIGLINNYK